MQAIVIGERLGDRCFWLGVGRWSRSCDKKLEDCFEGQSCIIAWQAQHAGQVQQGKRLDGRTFGTDRRDGCGMRQATRARMRTRPRKRCGSREISVGQQEQHTLSKIHHVSESTPSLLMFGLFLPADGDASHRGAFC